MFHLNIKIVQNLKAVNVSEYANLFAQMSDTGLLWSYVIYTTFKPGEKMVPVKQI